MQVPFLDLKAAWQELSPQLREAVDQTLDSGYYIGGPALSEFEQAFSQFTDTHHTVGVGNGLDALRLVLEAMGIGPGDEVIVPSHTYIATWLAVSQVGATPIPVEPAPGLFTIDPQKIEAAITPATRAIMPVHLYGQPADLDPILDLAVRFDLFVVEDAAQAQGAKYKGKRLGGHGHAVAWSFYPGKNLGAYGDAGAVTTNDDALAETISMLGNYGSKVKYDHELPGCNSRLDPLQAAMLKVKLSHLDVWNDRRRAIAERYTRELSDLPIKLPETKSWADPVWHLYVICTAQRSALQAYLAENGIQTLLHYPKACFDQPAYAKYAVRGDEWPEARRIAAEALSLPIGPHLSSDQVEHVIKAVRRFFGA